MVIVDLARTDSARARCSYATRIVIAQGRATPHPAFQRFTLRQSTVARRLTSLALPAAFARAGFIPSLSPSAATFLASAAVRLINGRPGAAFRFPFAHASFFVATFDVAGFAFLFSRVLLFASSSHNSLPVVPEENAAHRPNGFIFEKR
jgi:hypothetical protein